MPAPSSLLIVIGRVAGRPDGRAELIELLTWMQNESRREPGCLRYGFYESVEVEGEFIAVEEWESVEALRTDFGAPSVARFATEIGESHRRDSRGAHPRRRRDRRVPGPHSLRMRPEAG